MPQCRSAQMPSAPALANHMGPRVDDTIGVPTIVLLQSRPSQRQHISCSLLFSCMPACGWCYAYASVECPNDHMVADPDKQVQRERQHATVTLTQPGCP